MTHRRTSQSDYSPLPADRAFILQLRGKATAEGLCGRVEHVTSGSTARFESLADLMEFLRTFLGDSPGARRQGREDEEALARQAGRVLDVPEKDDHSIP